MITTTVLEFDAGLMRFSNTLSNNGESFTDNQRGQT